MYAESSPGRGAFLSWLSLGQLISWGSTLYLFGVLVEPIEQALQVSRGQTSFAYGLAMLTEGLLAWPVGRLIDAGHGRLVMTGGSLLAAACLAVMSQVSGILGFYVVWAVLGAALACILYTPVFSIVTRRFPTDYRRAIIVITFLGGLASTVFIPLMSAMLKAWGWSGMVLCLAAIHAFFCAPMHWILLRGEPQRASQQTKSALQPLPDQGAPKARIQGGLSRDQKRVMLLLGVFTALAMATASAITAHLVPLLRQRGMAEFWVIWIPAAIGAIQVLGRIMLMWGDGRINLHRVNALIVWLSPLSIVVLMLADASTPVLLGFACLWGIANGCQTIVKGTAIAQYVSQNNVAALNGALGTPVALARMLTPWMVGALFTPSAGYSHAIWVLLGLSLASALCFVLAQRQSLRSGL